MKAIITGASSGLGRDMAHILSERGYDIIAVARRKEKLEELKKELKTEVEILCLDLSCVEDCILLADRAQEAEVFINNAGFGLFGDFDELSLESELAMIDTNVRAVHILTKLVGNKFKEKNNGYILNVASLAAFFAGPLFGGYYATKSYVMRYTQAVREELKREGSKVNVSVLCPGPVHTEFEKIAKVNFGTGTEKRFIKIVLESRDVAEYAINKMFKGKEIIIPGFLMKAAVQIRRILPEKMLTKIVYLVQSKKCVVK